MASVDKHAYKLEYFGLRGRAEHLRLMFVQSDTPLGALPVLTIDGKTQLANSLAIGEYLARELGFAGKDNLETAMVLMYAHSANDVQEAAIQQYRINWYLMPFFEQQDFAKAQKVWHEDVKPNCFKPHAERIEAVLKDGRQWLVGDHVTWADLTCAEVTSRLINVVNDADAINDYPCYKALIQRVYSLPKIVEYEKTRKVYFGLDW